MASYVLQGKNIAAHDFQSTKNCTHMYHTSKTSCWPRPIALLDINRTLSFDIDLLIHIYASSSSLYPKREVVYHEHIFLVNDNVIKRIRTNMWKHMSGNRLVPQLLCTLFDDLRLKLSSNAQKLIFRVFPLFHLIICQYFLSYWPISIPINRT